LGAAAAGPCRTVELLGGDNLAVHIALEDARPGEILVVTGQTAATFGFWGAILTEYALVRGMVGLVTNLAVRDVDAIEALRFPVFAPHVCIQGTLKDDAGLHQIPVVIGSSIIRPGDWIVADTDGCVVVQADDIENVTAAAEAKVAREADVVRAIRGGASSRSALGLK
jgi:4-hydroxy-4-methyl-2-oxoglutarate aldolase